MDSRSLTTRRPDDAASQEQPFDDGYARRNAARARLLALLSVLLMVPAPVSRAQDWIYTVRPEDNLWDLSDFYLKHVSYWKRLQALNKVTDPYHLPPGTRLRFPVAWLKIQPAPARLVNLQGPVETILASGESQPASSGQLLQTGDSVQTGETGTALLEFADGSRLLLDKGSRLTLDAVSAYGTTGMVDTRLRLQRGRSESRVVPAAGPGSRYEIWTPAATSAVRGTEYRVAVTEEADRAQTEVTGGTVQVRGDGRSQAVPEGYGVIARLGEPLRKPEPLLEAPDGAKLPERFERIPIRFDIPAVPGARRYRVEIARDGSFATPLFQRVLPGTRVEGPDLADGDYMLRVRAIDSAGLEGLDALRPISVDARPEPPVLIAPRPDGVVGESKPHFQWSMPVNARSFHLQVATDPGFSRPVVDKVQLSAARFASDKELPPGFYFWRVATRDASPSPGPFSDAQKFERRMLPPSPELESAHADEREVTFRWRAGLPGQSYHFQFAEDEAFHKILVERTVRKPQVSVTKPASGEYFLRIKTLDPDGFSGAYGTTQKIEVEGDGYTWILYFAPLGLLFLLI